MKMQTFVAAAMAAIVALALSGLRARADSIAVDSAAGVKATIVGSGTVNATSAISVTMQVSADGGKTWTAYGLATITVNPKS